MEETRKGYWYERRTLGEYGAHHRILRFDEAPPEGVVEALTSRVLAAVRNAVEPSVSFVKRPSGVVEIGFSEEEKENQSMGDLDDLRQMLSARRLPDIPELGVIFRAVQSASPTEIFPNAARISIDGNRYDVVISNAPKGESGFVAHAVRLLDVMGQGATAVDALENLKDIIRK